MINELVVLLNDIPIVENSTEDGYRVHANNHWQFDVHFLVGIIDVRSTNNQDRFMLCLHDDGTWELDTLRHAPLLKDCLKDSKFDLLLRSFRQ